MFTKSQEELIEKIKAEGLSKLTPVEKKMLYRIRKNLKIKLVNDIMLMCELAKLWELVDG